MIFVFTAARRFFCEERGKNMKENEQKLTWQEIAEKINCPLNNLQCRKNEGVKQTYEKRIEHDTTLYIVQCNFCGKKAMEWGYDQFVGNNGFRLQSKDL